MLRFDDRVALITGAGRGMGREHALLPAGFVVARTAADDSALLRLDERTRPNDRSRQKGRRTMTDNKQLVLSWFQARPSSEEGRAMLADDFVWHIPKGMAELITGGPVDLVGPDVMLELNAVDRAVYAEGDTSFEMTFIIAEGDYVVLQAEIGATSHDGDPYLNRYVFSIRCCDGKIAEVWENADTKYWCDTIIGRPEQLEGVKQRLADVHASLR